MKKKLNMFDFFVIICVLCLVCFIGYKFMHKQSETLFAQMQKATYTVSVEDLKDVTANAIPENGPLYDTDGVSMGTIVGKEISNARILTETATGDYKVIENPDKNDVVITVEVEGIQKGEGFFFGGNKQFGVGSRLMMDANKITFYGRISSMKVE